MSVINQMLRDLERRRADAEAPPPEPLLPFAKPRRSAAPLFLLGAVAAASAGYWLASHRAAAPAAEPPAAALAPASQPPALASLPPAPTAAPPAADPVSPPAPPPAVPAQTLPPQPLASAPAKPVEPRAARSAAVDASAHGRKAGEARPGTMARKDKDAAKVARGGPIRSPEEDVEGTVLRGARLAAAGDAQQARAMLERVLRERPGHRQARALLGRLLIQQGDWNAAADLLDNRPSSTAGELAALRARVLLQRGQTEQAVAVLEAARGASPEDGTVLGSLGAVYQEQGRYGDAIAVYRQALAKQPAEPRWWLGLAVALDGGRHYGEALQAYREVLARPGLEGSVLAYARERADALQRIAEER